MARYINLDELLNVIDKRNGRLPLWLDEILMEDCKVADVEPVCHGHWILTKRTRLIPTAKIGLKESFTTCRNGTLVDGSNINKKAMILKKRITVIKPKCSECGLYGYDEDDITPYCPNCGAKMGGEENG